VTYHSGSSTLTKTGWPPKGIIYAKNYGTCATTFEQAQSYPSFSNGSGDTCGDVYIHGVVNSDLTIGSDNDIIVDGNITHGTGAAVGLIANGFVRVFHPCDSSTDTNTSTPSTAEDPSRSYMSNPEIDAAILAVNHSWAVDNSGCGAPMGNLNVSGAIAQRFRGTVGHFNQSTGQVSQGYGKAYTYDDTLRYHQPPYFLDPVEASWDIFSETEQVPAH
jgi:hypothetical protein